jgi:hypothetical protein
MALHFITVFTQRRTARNTRQAGLSPQSDLAECHCTPDQLQASPARVPNALPSS